MTLFDKKVLSIAFLASLIAVGCGGKSSQAAGVDSDDSAAVTDTITVASVTPEQSEQSAQPEQSEQSAPAEQTEQAESVAPSANATATVDYTFRPGKHHEGKLIALTFDDGPSSQTLKILQTLSKYNSHATFFVVGENITNTTKDYMRKTIEQGSEVCSHTWHHPYLSTLTADAARESVYKTNDAIFEATGVYPNFYRPPYLDADQGVLSAIGIPAASGLSSDDWVKTKSPEQITKDVLKLARPNAIIVMHDLGANKRTPVALETLIPELQKRGYTLVTVTDLFTSAGITPVGDKMYSSPTNAYAPNPSTTYRERKKRKAAAKAKQDSAANA